VNPEEVSEDIKLKRKSFLKAKHLQAVVTATGKRADLLVESLAPKNIPYAALRAGIQRIYAACNNGSFTALRAPKRILRLGVRDASVVGIKQRFSLLGYKISSMDNVVDAAMVAAINDIEWNLHIKPDGTMSPGGQVWAFLAVSCRDRLRQIQADMEKMRWFPQRFEDRFVFLNLAMNYFAMFDVPNKYVMSFRTINGRAERRTPTMHDHLTQIILNPSWVVPPTIFIEDKVKEIKNLGVGEIREYFESRYYEVWNLDLTKKIDPESINWWAIDSNADANFYIRQKPHYMNALGVAKFDLANPDLIYLHDTNQRELFTNANRLLSSGCIRLEKPIEVAEYLLKGTTWDREAILNTIAKPDDTPGESTKIKLKDPMPVYMVFLTSQASGDGILRFTYDTYGHNNLILNKLGASF